MADESSWEEAPGTITGCVMYSMTIRLHTDGDKCLYEQIYEHIRQEIRGGKLLEGERLPSHPFSGSVSAGSPEARWIMPMLSW